MTLSQAEQERLYDLERSGQLYVKPDPGAEPVNAEEFAAGVATGQAIGQALRDADQEYEQLLDSVWQRIGAILADADAEAPEQQAPADADVDRDELAGRAGAMMTMLYRKLDDRRADELTLLIEELLNAEPAQRESIVDALLEVE